MRFSLKIVCFILKNRVVNSNTTCIIYEKNLAVIFKQLKLNNGRHMTKIIVSYTSKILRFLFPVNFHYNELVMYAVRLG